MSEQLTREVEVVLARAVVEEDEFLVLAHRDAAVPIDPARAPGNLTRDEEVRREVDAVSDAGVEKVVELGHLLGTDGRAVLGIAKLPLVMVNAQRVVAETRKARAELLGVRLAHVVRREAEVDPVEALLDAGLLLELEMVALPDDATVLARGGVDPTGGGKVEGRAGFDIRRILHGDPFVIRPDPIAIRIAANGVDTAGLEGKLIGLSGLQLSVVDRDAHGEILTVPFTVVLDHAPDRALERDADCFATRMAEFDRVGHRATEDRLAEAHREGDGLCAEVDTGVICGNGINAARKRPIKAQGASREVLLGGQRPRETPSRRLGRFERQRDAQTAVEDRTVVAVDN